MIGYLDLPSGLSGDMMLGCLVDAGWPIGALRDAIGHLQLPSDEWVVEAHPVMKGPLRATLVDVRVKEGHAHRHLRHVRQIIEDADLPADVKDRAVAVFVRLADAEAKVHGTTPEKVHFHECGALDAIVDIVGSVAGLAALGIDRLFAGPPALGGGWVDTAHGRLPVPVPATVELLAAVGAPTRPGPGEGELLTPTGAALLAELATFTQPTMTLNRNGLGAGRKDFAWPNIARLWVGQPVTDLHAAPTSPAGGRDLVVQLETNIDDMNPQLYPAVLERLLEMGARDAWLTPVQMKKGRPGIVLSVLAPAELQTALCEVLIRETTTLGVRVVPLLHRHEARREHRTVQTPFGEVRLKLKWLGEQQVGAAPEYDDCLAAARAASVPVKTVWEAALRAADGP